MSKGDHVLSVVDVSETVKESLRRFFRSLGREIPEINDDIDLIEATGASSDEGVDFAIDLSDAIGVEVPHDFNPFVHPSGRRGMKVRELVEHSKTFVSALQEISHGG
jgi:hypothetical protein